MPTSETQKFDYCKFEKLSGKDLAFFCVKKETLATVDKGFFEYFRQNRETMDDVHLEYSLYIFEKIGFKEAYPFVADYIDHPVTFIRIPAIRILTQWLNNYDIDDAVLENPEIINKVKKTLAEHSDLMGVDELKHIIEKKQKRSN